MKIIATKKNTYKLKTIITYYYLWKICSIAYNYNIFYHSNDYQMFNYWFTGWSITTLEKNLVFNVFVLSRDMF